jgi:hypothetical protein
MTQKRDGPADVTSVAGPGQKGVERPRLLPQRKFPRNTQGHIFPTSHRYTRRRQEQSWHSFDVRLYLKPGTDAHALYTLLKIAAQKYGLEVGDVTEIRDDKSKVKKETDPLA